MERRITHVKFAQSVELNRKQLTHCVQDLSKASNIRTSNTSEIVKMTRTEHGVMLETESDCVEVFYTNIAYIKYEKMADAPKASKK